MTGESHLAPFQPSLNSHLLKIVLLRQVVSPNRKFFGPSVSNL